MLHDILNGIQRIENYMVGMSFGEFIQDDKTTNAIIRNFEVIGEAANQLRNASYILKNRKRY